MTEGGIGTVRVVTRHPFDQPEGFLAGSVQGVYSDLADDYDPKIALIGSKIFLDGTLGVLLSTQFETRHIDSNNARTTGWLRRAPTATGAGATPGRGTDVNADGTLDWVPEIPRYIIDRRETTRTGLQWRGRVAADRRFLAVSRRHLCERRARKSAACSCSSAAAGGLIDYANSTVGRGQHRRSHRAHQQRGVPDGSRVSQHQRRARARAVQRHPRRGLDHAATGSSMAASPTRAAKFRTTRRTPPRRSSACPRAIIDYTGGEGAPNFSFPGIDTTNGALVNNLAAVFNPRTNDQQEEGARFNVEFKPELDWLTSVKAGVEKRDVTMESLLFARTIQLSSRTPTPASAGATTTVAVAQSVIAGIVDGNSGINDVPFFDTGDLGFNGGIKYWNDNGDRDLRSHHRRQRPHDGSVRRQYESRTPMARSRTTWIPGRSRKRRWPAICRPPSHSTTLSCRSARC